MSYISRVEGRVVGRLVQLMESTRGQEERGGEGRHRMGITRRAEDFPLIISQYGLSSALTFFLSKVGRDDSELLDYGVDYFRGAVSLDQELGKEKELVKDAGEEGKGYASYLALVLVWPLGEAMDGAGLDGVVKGLKPPGGRVRGAAGILLRNLQGIQERELLLEAAAMPGLLELKKITRALGR